ncbi:MAG: AAA family ATPase [Nanoarchaeota archaeon]|nr:AAA family ATPase [Nanoarchaeota archaeon]
MNRSILITGVAGSGKSAICKELKKLSYKAHDIENIRGLFTMIDKTTGKPTKDYDNYDFKKVKKHDWVCDKKKLKRLIKKNSGLVFYCGIGSNTIDIIPFFDKVFLLKANRKNTCERLTKRTSNDFGRTAEVQKWIFTWKKWWEDKMIKRGAIVINANRDIKEITSNIIKRSEKV